jgi:hypothetical protein
MRRRVEIVTSGFDEWLQLVGGDPQGTSNSVGLRVPTLATALNAAEAGIDPLEARYLFNLCSFSVPHGVKARILGYRQLATLGYVQPATTDPTAPAAVVEQEITSPFWRFQDGNISWHIRQLGAPGAQGIPPRTGNPLAVLKNPLPLSATFRYSESPALLYENMTLPAGDNLYVDLETYQPPKKGRPWGQTVYTGHQGTFYDLRAEWHTPGAWTSLGESMEIEGPDTIAFFASVRQSDPTSRGKLKSPAAGGAFTFSGGLSDEEQFLQNFPGAIYWRVGGALIVETEACF